MLVHLQPVDVIVRHRDTDSRDQYQEADARLRRQGAAEYTSGDQHGADVAEDG